jgi:hypothetical protein
MNRNGIKLTAEWEDYLTHDETDGTILEDPVVYALLMIRLKSRWTAETTLFDVGTWPLGIQQPYPQVKHPRLPGFPAWEDYPSVKLDPEVISDVGIITLRDDRVNVTLELLRFSQSNFTGNDTNPRHATYISI